MLATKRLTKTFGGLAAVSNLDLELQQGELVGLIGPNGAGKTTVFNLLTGVYTPTEGDIILEGKSVVGLKPYQITARGMARTFQNIRLFNSLSVIENVKVACHWHSRYSLAGALLRLKSCVNGERQMQENALELLEMFNLAEKKDEPANSLPYGEQRRLEIVRALAAKPKLLLLDEPAAGMNPLETKDLMELIKKIRRLFGLTILLIEHDMSLVMGICERIYVLDYGKVIAQGTPEEIKNNKRVIEAYLGEEA
ncbi:MAG: ABC transporter ATP-binding protein [Firmicutes bacterium]|nr:ABC transporter ATP-binding protein [Bacillota bacterium]